MLEVSQCGETQKREKKRTLEDSICIHCVKKKEAEDWESKMVHVFPLWWRAHSYTNFSSKSGVCYKWGQNSQKFYIQRIFDLFHYYLKWYLCLYNLINIQSIFKHESWFFILFIDLFIHNLYSKVVFKIAIRQRTFKYKIELS